jgi:EH domain-containing protein 1
MGSDASPKKWTLKEQRETYLKWFSLADDGSIRDSTVEFS